MDNSNNIDTGYLKISATTDNGYTPIPGARIEISSTGDPERILEVIETDSSGQSQAVALDAPPLEYSMEPSDNQPYSEYNIRVTAPNYDEQIISGIQILSGETGIQSVNLLLSPENQNIFNPIVIGGHTLWEYYPPKIAEAEIKPMNETGEIVLRRVVVPETIVVHDGVPSDPTATNYYVPYAEYIKNVACCEIYSTWPEATIQANVLAIMSFTLNRVYTEWYRNRGYNFTITSSTAYDQKWINGRNYFEPISRIVDEIFTNYISKPNIKQPILTQYCDGRQVSCPNWLSQWGSKYLGDQNYSTIEILRYYYGDKVGGQAVLGRQ